jgi:cytoskeletal protein RodZ
MQVGVGLRRTRLYAASGLVAVSAVLGGGVALLVTATAAAVPAAPPAVVQPTVQDGPTPTVTVTPSLPTVTETEARATVTETEPAPTVTETQPIPTVTVTETVEPPTVTATAPEVVVTATTSASAGAGGQDRGPSAPVDRGSGSRPLQTGPFTTASSGDASALAAALAGAAVALVAAGGVFAACRAVVYLR